MDKSERLMELNNTKPDRLPSALLVSGFILASLFGAYSIVIFFAGGRYLPHLFLPLILLGGLGILVGAFRARRGNPGTKQQFRTTSRIIRKGMVAGCIAAFGVYLVLQSKDLNSSWILAFSLLSIIWSLLFGIPFGGMGGMLLASIWKNRLAPTIGGASAGAIIALTWMLLYFG